MVKGETRTHVLLLGRPQKIPILCQVPEVATCTATNSDYATCGLKRVVARKKKHPHFPITLAYRNCKKLLYLECEIIQSKSSHHSSCSSPRISKKQQFKENFSSNSVNVTLHFTPEKPYLM